MSKLYWIYVLGNLQKIDVGLFIASNVLIIIGIILYWNSESGCSFEKFSESLTKISFCIWVITLIGLLLLPTEEQLLLLFNM